MFAFSFNTHLLLFQNYSLRTRSRCANIFTTCTNLISNMQAVNKVLLASTCLADPYKYQNTAKKKSTSFVCLGAPKIGVTITVFFNYWYYFYFIVISINPYFYGKERKTIKIMMMMMTLTARVKASTHTKHRQSSQHYRVQPKSTYFHTCHHISTPSKPFCKLQMMLWLIVA